MCTARDELKWCLVVVRSILSMVSSRNLEKQKSGIPTPVFLLGEFHGQRSLAGYSPWNLKELDRTEQLILSLCAESHSQKAAAGFSGFFVLS